jgi:hypothetical protein
MRPAPLVDFCNRIAPRARPWTIQTPRTATAVARRHSSDRGWLRLTQNPLPCGRGSECARPTETSRARDRVWKRLRFLLTRHLSSRSLAIESFAPPR